MTLAQMLFTSVLYRHFKSYKFFRSRHLICQFQSNEATVKKTE